MFVNKKNTSYLHQTLHETQTLRKCIAILLCSENVWKQECMEFFGMMASELTLSSINSFSTWSTLWSFAYVIFNLYWWWWGSGGEAPRKNLKWHAVYLSWEWFFDPILAIADIKICTVLQLILVYHYIIIGTILGTQSTFVLNTSFSPSFPIGKIDLEQFR